MRLFTRSSSVLLFTILLFGGCLKEKAKIDYRQQMRSFVENIYTKAQQLHPGFLIVPQNGLELLTSDGTPNSLAETQYLNSINAVGQEELFYGFNNVDDVLTPEPDHTQMLSMCTFAKLHNKPVFVTDYCYTPSKVTDSYNQNAANGFVGFAADHRELDDIPSGGSLPVFNNDTITSLDSAKNFLYIINPAKYSSKQDFINAVAQTKYDLVIMDLYFDSNTMFTASDLAAMRTKPGGGSRLFLCYMSIGQAENYRWYWKNYWYGSPPSFLVGEDPQWVDNYYVRYWDPQWQEIICSGPDSYMQRINGAGFDGAYLDMVNAYEFFEEK